MEIFTVKVGMSLTRPIRPDSDFSFVTLMADSGQEAMLVAAQMVATRSEMPTSTTILSVLI